MTIPFVSTLRTTPGVVVRVGAPGPAPLSLRVEIPERWDVVRLEAAPEEPVQAVKVAALAALIPGADAARYVVKLRGYEVLDESRSLAESGAIDGSIFLVTHRRRRPVR